MSKVESADLILKLYDLRRETKMREARNWIFGFNPTSADQIMQTMMDPEVGPYLRMVTSYWEMAATFVKHGAIDADMFSETAGEHMMIFAKVEPFLVDLREMFKKPSAFANLESVIMAMPNGAEDVKKTQEWMKSMEGKMGTEQTSEASA
jgi:hypothetical protein